MECGREYFVYDALLLADRHSSPFRLIQYVSLFYNINPNNKIVEAAEIAKMGF